MTSFVFIIGIVYGILFILFNPCGGKIFLPPGGDTLYAQAGSVLEIAWTFNDPPKSIRGWKFINATNSFDLARIIDDGDVDYQTNLLEFEIKKPGRLILKNVDIRYNGTYRFTILGAEAPSEVTVFIVVRPTAVIVPTIPTSVDEGGNILHVCQSIGGNPPANETWLKDGKEIVPPLVRPDTLNLTDVNETANGTYTCVVQSYTLKNNKSIDIKVLPNVPPVVTNCTSVPEKPILGKKFTITVKAIGRPPPTYKIVYNNTKEVSSENTYTETAAYKHAGLYTCFAENRAGSSSKNITITVVEKEPVSTSIAPSPTRATATSTSSSNRPDSVGPAPGGGDDDGGMSVGVIVGIVIGVLVLVVIISGVVWWCKSKEKERGYGGNVNPSSGEDRLDNAYESIESNKKASGANREDNPYASPDERAYDNPSGNPSAEPSSSTPAVYAQVNKPKKAEPPSVTYATLDTMAMQPSIKRANDGGRQPQTEYASINFKDLKGDLV